MTEPLSVVASGIAVVQLATQVTSSIIKLKNYWEQINNVPDEIRSLFRELDALNLILHHIQDEQRQRYSHGPISDGAYMKESLDLCRNGAEELGALVIELAQNINCKRGLKKKFASAKVVFKDEEIKRLKRKMKSAIRLLTLAYQCHTSAMMQLQPDYIVAKVSTHLSSFNSVNRQFDITLAESEAIIQVPTSNKITTRRYDTWTISSSWIRHLLGDARYCERRRKYKGKEQDELFARYELPNWLSYSAWDCYAHSTLSGWQFSLNTYRILSNQSPFFVAVQNKDLITVRKMLRNREAFVSDRASKFPFINRAHDDPWTALHIAAQNGDLNMSQLLLSEGADPLAIDDNGRTPLHVLVARASFLTFDTTRRSANVEDVLRLFLRSGAKDLLIDDTDVLERTVSPLSIFRCIEQEMYPPFASLSLQHRVDVLSWQTYPGWHNVPIILRSYFVNSFGIAPEVLKWANGRHESLLHLFANQVNYHSLLSIPIHGKLDNSIPVDVAEKLHIDGNCTFLWRGLVRDFVTAGAPLHTIDTKNRTPFLTTFAQYGRAILLEIEYDYKIFSRITTAAKLWLEDLYTCGVDLQNYGTEERFALERMRGIDDNFYCDCNATGGNTHSALWCPCSVRVITFSHGPHPDDWIFWFSEYTDQFAGEFWRMMEAKQEAGPEINQLAMPGSWNEEDGELC